MTRQEAIQILIKSWTLSTEGYSEARDMAIKALEQEPCETIHGSTYGGVSWGGTYTPQELKTGHWIKLFLTDTSDIDGQCSECGFIHRFIDGHTAQYNYCPNCGARMESEDK